MPQVGTFIEGDPERDIPPELAAAAAGAAGSSTGKGNGKKASAAQQQQYPPTWVATAGQDRRTDVFALSDDVRRGCPRHDVHLVKPNFNPPPKK